MTPHPAGRRLASALVAALGLLFLVGLVRFAAARPVIEVRFPRSAAPSADRVNLAHHSRGPIVRASSADASRRHHPGYLVDGHAAARELEKWASSPGDAAPWIEVQLDGPHDLDEVALELPSAHGEHAELNLRRYRIDCFRSGPAGTQASTPAAALEVAGNLAARPRHAIACPQTDRVRISFGLEPGTARDAARVYEVELWGR